LQVNVNIDGSSFRTGGGGKGLRCPETNEGSKGLFRERNVGIERGLKRIKCERESPDEKTGGIQPDRTKS